MSELNDDDLILVTGASGFLAGHIIKQLLEKGLRVRGTVRSLKDEKKVEPIRKYVASPKHPIDLVEADLTDEKSWLSAVTSDVTYVIHPASPVPNYVPKDENEVIKPAVSGVLNVLNACIQKENKVKRVVFTSSLAAISGESFHLKPIFSELDFNDPKNAQPYTKSKILAEKAAWDFVNTRKSNNEPCFELVVINPGYISGPVLSPTFCASMEPIKRLMQNELPFLPDVALPGCDVRDVAMVHILSLTKPEVVSNRYLIVGNVESETLQQYAFWLKEEFESKGYKMSTKLAPNFLLRIIGFFDSTVGFVVPMLGMRPKYDNKKVIDTFKLTQIDRRKSIIDMAYSMIEQGVIKKKK